LDFDLIESVLGSAPASDAADLPCDLADDCSDYLDVQEKEGLWTMPDANTRYSADVQLESDIGQSSIAGLGSSITMEGHAAYTATACGSDACPFYLAQFEMLAPSASTVSIPNGSTPIVKTVSSLSIELEQPALGLWLPASTYVIFPSETLRVKLSATLAGSTNSFGENGWQSHSYLVENYVWGYISGTNLLLATDGADSLGAWYATSQFVEE